MRKNFFICIFSLLMTFSLIGQISAGFTSVNITNKFQNGIVDIEINEKQTNESNEEISQVVLPFSKIEKNPHIKNNGSDCYVRARITSSNESIIKDATILGINPNWIRTNEGYYYYTKPLKNNETIEMFDGIKLGNIDKEYQTTNFNIDIKVDAVQSKNFIADFNSPTPWGKIEVLKTDNNNSNIVEYRQIPDESFKVIYRDDVKGMIKNFDSFFTSAQKLMPGDCYEDILELQNNTNTKQTIYFATQNTINKEFLDKVLFSIIDENNNVVFSGNLGESKEIALATIEANTNSNIRFKIEVPKELTNEFALETSSVKWIFSTEDIIQPDAPQTGDNTNITFYTFLMIVSIIGLFFSVRGLRYDKKNN